MSQIIQMENTAVVQCLETIVSFIFTDCLDIQRAKVNSVPITPFWLKAEVQFGIAQMRHSSS